MTKKHWAPLVAFLVLVTVYSISLASGVTLWDSGEFLAAIKTLGIPHPAGTPLYILVAKCWALLFAPVFGFARSVNLFSAIATAGGCAIVAALFARWARDVKVGICAALIAGTMSTVWLSATETEVYALTLLLGAIILWASDRAGTSGDSRWAMLVAYLAGLAVALHLATLVVLPAAALLTLTEGGGSFRLPRGRRRSDGHRAYHSPLRLGVLGVVLLLLGASCIAFLLLRARHDPGINQGNPSTLDALWDVFTRRQYGDRSFFPRSAPLWLQIGNLIEYSDWQFALGVSSDPGPSFWRTSVTMIFAGLGATGCYHHHRIDRRSWKAWVLLIITATLGVILYLNLKAGPSIGHGIVDEWNHEARERDYFFFFAFIAWGAWAGLGAVRLAKRLPSWLAAAPFVVAAIPIVLNWDAVDRRTRPDDASARSTALGMLEPLPANAVMLAIGDNDTYPLWYLQHVEGIRRDVTVVTIPLLSAAWYRAELARRYALLDPGAPSAWPGADATLASIRTNASARGRPVVESPLGSGGIH